MSLVEHCDSSLVRRKRISARLDLLDTMLDQPPSASNSPHDSLSPIDDGPKGKTYSWDQAVDYTTSLLSERCEAGNFSLWKSDVQSRGRNHQLNSEDEVVASDANPTALQEPHSSPFPRSGSIRHELSQASPPSTKACPPRFRLTVSTHRPSELSLTKTNGATTISRAEIKRCILNARIGADNATIVQVPRPKANHLPKTPGTPSPLFVMGNKPSSVSESPAPDDASPRSVVRRLPRQSSLNPAKHLDLKAAVPKDFTATVLRVQRHGSKATLNAFDGADERGSKRDMVSPVSSRENPSAITPPSSSRHATGRTIPNPLFPTPTKGRSASVIESTNPEEDQIADKTDVEETQRGQRGLVLSPSIPAPSPLPEDSPHQYGLKDRMDTPDLAEPEEIKVVKPRRRSSGLEIFHVSLNEVAPCYPIMTDLFPGSEDTAIGVVLPQWTFDLAAAR